MDFVSKCPTRLHLGKINVATKEKISRADGVRMLLKINIKQGVMINV
jgi:hypothetical protein